MDKYGVIRYKNCGNTTTVQEIQSLGNENCFMRIRSQSHSYCANYNFFYYMNELYMLEFYGSS